MEEITYRSEINGKATILIHTKPQQSMASLISFSYSVLVWVLAITLLSLLLSGTCIYKLHWKKDRRIKCNYSQVQYAIRCMKYALKNDISAMEPKLEAQNAYTSHLKRQFNGTVWKSGCSSWYLNKDGDVRIANSLLYFDLFIYLL